MKAPKYKRADRAVSAVRDYIIRHTKASNIRLGKYLNLKLWEQGMKNVPHTISVETTKDDEGIVTAELVGAPKEVKEEIKKHKKSPEEKKEAAEKATETPAAAADKKETIEGNSKKAAAKTETKKETQGSSKAAYRKESGKAEAAPEKAAETLAETRKDSSSKEKTSDKKQKQ